MCDSVAAAADECCCCCCCGCCCCCCCCCGCCCGGGEGGGGKAAVRPRRATDRASIEKPAVVPVAEKLAVVARRPVSVRGKPASVGPAGRPRRAWMAASAGTSTSAVCSRAWMAASRWATFSSSSDERSSASDTTSRSVVAQEP
eukprot:scaffold116825_cov45-Phaeocystis_antarctica.AAC.2